MARPENECRKYSKRFGCGYRADRLQNLLTFCLRLAWHVDSVHVLVDLGQRHGDWGYSLLSEALEGDRQVLLVR